MWIEDLLGVSPDGGNGLFEAMIVVALVLALLSVVAVRRRTRGGRPRR
jgi:hypothetical protein